MEAISTFPGRREKRKQQTRIKIEDAAYRLFKEHGIEDTSIEQICEHADVARRTFYGHYPNKQALLSALSQSRVFGTADHMINEIMTQHATTRARMGAMIGYMERNLASYNDVDRHLILVSPNSYDDHNHLRDVSVSLQDRFAEFFREGQASGDTTSRFSPDMLASMVMGTINSLMISWALNPDFPVKQKLEEAQSLFDSVISG